MPEISYIYKGMTYRVTILLCFIFKLAVIYMAFMTGIRLKLCLSIANPLRNTSILQVKFV